MEEEETLHPHLPTGALQASSVQRLQAMKTDIRREEFSNVQVVGAKSQLNVRDWI